MSDDTAPAPTPADDPTGGRPANPALDVDDVVHQRVRLAILVVAHEASRVEFTYLRDALDLTAGNLSRHLATLAGAGLVGLAKDERGARPRTWVRITPKGRRALAREMALLEALVRRVRPPSDDRGAPGASWCDGEATGRHPVRTPTRDGHVTVHPSRRGAHVAPPLG